MELLATFTSIVLLPLGILMAFVMALSFSLTAYGVVTAIRQRRSIDDAHNGEFRNLD
jgi:hypothetical protein